MTINNFSSSKGWPNPEAGLEAFNLDPYSIIDSMSESEIDFEMASIFNKTDQQAQPSLNKDSKINKFVNDKVLKEEMLKTYSEKINFLKEEILRTYSEETTQEVKNSVLESYVKNVFTKVRQVMKEIQEELENANESEINEGPEVSILESLDQEPVAKVESQVQFIDTPASTVNVNTENADKILKETKERALIKEAEEKMESDRQALIAEARKQRKLAKQQVKQSSKGAIKRQEKAQRELEEVSKPKKTLIQQKAVTKVTSTFNLVEISGTTDNKNPLEFEDLTYFAEDFSLNSSWSPQKLGQRHMEKRLELFNIQCSYVYNNREKKELNGHNLHWKGCKPNQFQANRYVVPTSVFKKLRAAGYERAHISLLNKLIVKKSSENILKRIEDKIDFNQRGKVSLNDIFNLCDIAPSIANKIDGYIENMVRTEALKLLEAIKNNQKSLVEAATEIRQVCWKYLSELKGKIESKDTNPHHIDNEKVMETNRDILAYLIENQKSAIQYIDGMIQATKS